MGQKITNQEIFSVGKWNGDEYSIGDLDSMVSAFHSLKLNVPLKLGHTEAQKWFGQVDGHPALGWVESVRRVGTKLVADFANVPDALVEMIRNRSYRSKSAEIYWDFMASDGQKWPRTLKAVSLLGAELPAVTNLNDLHTTLMADNSYSMTNCLGSYTASDGTYTITTDSAWKDYQWESTKQEEDNMTAEQEKAYKDKLAELETTAKAEKTRADEAEARAVKAEAELQGREEKHAVEQFSLEVEALVKEGKVLPKEKDGLVRQFVALGSGTKKYGEKEFNPRAELLDSLKSREQKIEFKDKAKGGEAGTDDVPPAVAVYNLAQKFMRDKKATYADAIGMVKEENPELWMAYMNPGKGGE